MKSIISLELASVIFGEKISYVDESITIKKTGRFVKIVGETFSDDFEISYLAINKCKYWANVTLGLGYDIGYSISSSQTQMGGAPCGIASVFNRCGENVFDAPTCITEEEAIFYATEFIVKKTKQP